MLTPALTHEVERGDRGRICTLTELHLRLGVHQQHVGVAHQDDVDAAVPAVRLVRDVEVLPDVEPR
jgi:hypothetical protein